MIVDAEHRSAFDQMIGRMDRGLSEMLYFAKRDGLDEMDWQTLKHHAEDMQGAAKKVLDLFQKKYEIPC